MKLKYLIGSVIGTAAAYTGMGHFKNKQVSAEGFQENKQFSFNFNKPVIDLKEQNLNAFQMRGLLTSVEDNKHTGNVIWPTIWKTTICSPEVVKLKKQVEDRVVGNNKNYQKHPNDFTYALLSSHAYQDSNVGDQVEFKPDDDNHKYNSYLSGWEVQGVYNKPEAGRYYSASYCNDENRQLVLAHRGTTVQGKDLFSLTSPWTNNINGILGRGIVDQQIQAYVVTKEVAAYAKANGYNLSFTGHSLGAWLAELSLYFSEFDFDCSAKAVTFDSPGSIVVKSYTSNIHNPGTKREAENLDITTYLSSPNFVNTVNEHIGKAYRLYPEIKKPTFIEKTIGWSDWLLSLIGYKTNDVIDLEPLWSIFGHSLNPLIATFNPETGKPLRYEQVDDWPVIEYTPRQAVGRNMMTQWLGSAGSEPSNTEELEARDLLREVVKGTTLEVLLNLVWDVKEGRIDQTQYLECWRQLQLEGINGDTSRSIGSSTTEATNEFLMRYKGHHKLREVNLKEDTFVDSRDIDHYLLRLISFSPRQIEKDYDDLTARQLISLREQYSIEQHKTKRIIISEKSDLTVEQLKNWLERVVAVSETNKLQKELQQVSSSHDNLARENELELTFAKTSKKLDKFVKDFEAYGLPYNPKPEEIKLIEQVKQIITSPNYIKGMHITVSDQGFLDTNLNNYLYCVYRAACHYEGAYHDGKKARELLESGKNLAEHYLINMRGSNFTFENLSPPEIYSELSQSQMKGLPEMYAKIIYQLGRTYIYQGDREEAVKYFKLSKYLGEELNLFEGYLSVRNGLQTIEGDRISSSLKLGKCKQAKDKLIRSIDLYEKLKATTKEYRLDYNPNDTTTKPITPAADKYCRAECGEQIIKHCAKLILITSDPQVRAEYMEKIITHLVGTDYTIGLLDDSKQGLPGRKVSSIYNTLGDALLELYEDKEEFKLLKDSIIKPLQLTEREDLKLIEEVFLNAKSKSGPKDFTKADSYDGLMRVYQKQIDSGVLTLEQVKELLGKIAEYQQNRDKTDLDLKRTVKYDDLMTSPLCVKFDGSDCHDQGNHGFNIECSGRQLNQEGE